MEVGLFIPCYIDQFYPHVGQDTLSLLEKMGCKVVYPEGQTCCGQPLANSGLEHEAKPIYSHLVDTFAGFAYHVKHHYDIVEQDSDVKSVRERMYDITAFLTDVLKVNQLEARFPHRVGIHQSCHGLRGLRMARSTELQVPPYSKWRQLLELVKDIQLVELDRPDECCGFGGTFSVGEEAVSVKMGQDRIADHKRNGAEFITSGDMSCLMHMEGLLRRKKDPVKVIHLVEILNG